MLLHSVHSSEIVPNISQERTEATAILQERISRERTEATAILQLHFLGLRCSTRHYSGRRRDGLKARNHRKQSTRLCSVNSPTLLLAPSCWPLAILLSGSSSPFISCVLSVPDCHPSF